MRRRLLYLAPLLLILSGLLTQVWHPAIADALSGYAYTDTAFSAITGPSAARPTSSATVTYTKSSSTQYKATEAGICDETIVLASAGATSGVLTGSCPFNREQLPPKIGPTTITITSPGGGSGQNYSVSWIDHSHLTLVTGRTGGPDGATTTGEVFVDGKIDSHYEYTSTDSSTCKASIIQDAKADDGSFGANGPASITTYSIPGGGNDSCVGITQIIPVGNFANQGAFNDYFSWADAGTISTSDGTGMIFTTSAGDPASFNDTGGTDHSDGTCHSQIIGVANGGATGTLVMRYSPNDSPPFNSGWPNSIANASFSLKNGCEESSPISVNIANPVQADGGLASALPAGSSALGSGDSTASPELNCYAGLNPLNWLLCGLIKGLAGIINGVDAMINSMLSIGTVGNGDDPTQIFGASGTAPAYYQAWSDFRNLSLGLMVIAGLIVVIAQAVGVEILDAYTVRKVLPRLVIAAVAITLSWDLMQFFVKFTNDLGYGVRSLIYSPFSHLGGSININLSGFQGLGVTLATSVFAASLGPLGLLSFVATGALAVFVAFLVLIIRQILIIVLILFAPLAIVAYILPNTQKIYKIWWDSFSKALLMFPIISAFIAAGRVFSAVASQNASNPLNQFIAFAAYFAPYFLLPLTFRFAGGALANIGGFVNDRHRGAFDGLKNFRSNQTKQRRANAIDRAKTGNTFKRAGEKGIRRGLNRGIEGATQIGSIGFDPRHMASNLRESMRGGTEAHLEEANKDPELAGIFGDDAKVWAASKYGRGAIEEELVRRDAKRFGGEENRHAREDAASQIISAQRRHGNEIFQRARIRSQAKTGTGYEVEVTDPETGVKSKVIDASLMAIDINNAYGADRNGAGRALAEMRSSLANSGQVAGLAGYGAWASAMEDLYHDRIDAKTANARIMVDTVASISPSQAVYGKPSSAAAIAKVHADTIQELVSSANTGAMVIDTGKEATDLITGQKIKVMRAANQSDIDAAMASAAGVYDAMAQASPQNASAFANVLFGTKVKGGPAIPGVREQKARLRPDGQPEVDTDGHAVFDIIEHPAVSEATVREYIESQMSRSPEFVNRRRDFSQATYAQAQQSQAAAAAATGANAVGNNPVGGNPTTRTPF